jgi:hypothetical protein
MSNLSTQVFGDMNYLYEHIANRGKQNYYRWMCFSCEMVVLDKRRDDYKKEFLNYKKNIILQ